MDPCAFTRIIGALMKKLVILGLCLIIAFSSCKMIGGSSQPYLTCDENEVR